ncbi:MAG: NADP-dependent malic enzyme [Deltaproteobacteria bacterium]|nr:NADP-dependent malic enzyme [Deltaproteobacteria bacterium]
MTTPRREESLLYHSSARPGKVEVVPTKPCLTARDLGLAYAPGAAEPCLEIKDNPDSAYRYTSKGNLVAVVSNGSAVFNLGDLGASASKPALEGTSVLFKRFADIDAYDLEIESGSVDEIVRTIKLLEPTFGGIDIENIRAPDCFEIEDRLREIMDIPVFHGEQHGTAIVSGAALVNACEIAGKPIQSVRLVFAGAGAAAVTCARFYERLGVAHDNIVLVDAQGVVRKGRSQGLNKYQQHFAQNTRLQTLAEIVKGADVLVGCSVQGAISQELIRSMAKSPIVFALASPDPEITYPDAKAARNDAIVATSRGDHPNEINSVLGFPFIFRGALDVRARKITEEMKVAAARALAELARLEAPEQTPAGCGNRRYGFGPDYLIPKPFDTRVLLVAAPAVALAATDGGVARVPLQDIEAYRADLERRLSPARCRLQLSLEKAQQHKQRIVFPEGDSARVLRAAVVAAAEGVCRPILLGSADVMRSLAADNHLDLSQVTLLDPAVSYQRSAYAQKLYELRQRRGVTPRSAQRLVHDRLIFGCMMVRTGDADGLVAGVNDTYVDCARPVLQILRDKGGLAAGMYMLVFKNETKFIADCTVNIDPAAEELAAIAIMAHDYARQFEIKPHVAMLAYASFGSVRHATTLKARQAVALVKQQRPDIEIDGEMQADVAVNAELRQRDFPFAALTENANVLICPDLSSANIAHKLLQHLADAEVVGPMLLGIDYAANISQRGASTEEIIRLAAVTAVSAQEHARTRL